MSTKVDRRLRRKCNNENTPSKFSKSLSDNTKKRSSETLCSTSMSSPKSDVAVVAEKRIRRKKIRSTQDFNHLSSSLTSVDSDESTKPKAKRTKKNLIFHSLPKITNVVEDFSSKSEETSDTQEISSKRKTRKKNRKQNNQLPEGEPDIQPETHLIPMQYIKKKTRSEEYQRANSTSDSNRDSEVEIITKNKKLKNKKKNVIIIDVEAPELQANTMDECYAKRIKKLLSEEPVRKTRSSNVRNSLVSTPVSLTKPKRNSTNKKISIKSIEQKTPKADDKNTISKRSISVTLSHQSTPHPKMKLRLSSYDRALKGQSNLSQNLPSATTKIKRKSSMLSEYVSFDMGFESDDVFVDTNEPEISDLKNTNFNQEQAMNNTLSNNVSMKIRKSVRFKSPEQNIRRETLILSKPTSRNTSINLLRTECKNDVLQTSDMRASTSGSTKRNSTFEIFSPKVIDSGNSFLDITQNTNNSDHNLSYNKPSEINLSREPSNLSIKRKSSSIELFSPQRKSFRKSTSDRDVSVIRNAVKNLTPVNYTETSGSCIKRINTVDENIPYVLNSKSTFPKDDVIDTELDTTQALLSVNPPKLIRTATFTKDDETITQISALPIDSKYSSPLHTSYSKPIDTSKVNKRRRWDKSRPSVSFLDNSIDIGNISAPWFGVESNDSVNLGVDTSEQNLESKCSSTINNSSVNKTLIKNRDIPSASSTPFPKRKTNSLREAVLKGNKDAPVNKSGKVNEKEAPHKFVRTKVPNFALIHQRALDKMENIKELSQRKAERARLLLSGHKPPNDALRKASSNRKELKFSPSHLKSTPLNEFINKSLNKSNISVTKIGKVSPSKSNPKVASKENRVTPIDKRREVLKMKSHIPVKSKVPNTVIAEKKGFTRFGFKQRTGGVKVATKDEQVKAVAQKTKITKNSLEERRTIIQGVRSNRRFELLMQRRNK